ncbi:MAG: UvrD-helicase domain-containing protein [Fimbriimonas sp.]
MALPLRTGAVAPAEIERIAAQLGLTLAHDEQRQYLASLDTVDIQAAPGCGKTTLTSAKLCLLAGAWESSTSGVCVLSHTNVAKNEILAIVGSHSDGRQLAGYPHFIGTIQSFVNTFLALPALKAQGAEIKAIDDAIYSRMAYRRLQQHRFATLRTYASSRHNIEPAILTATFRFIDGQLKVAGIADLSDTSKSGRQFTDLKLELAADGYYRYADMYAIASEYLHANPLILDALRERFPLVIVDEAQDTDGVQNSLLCSLFLCPQVTFQRIGDVNQAIFQNGIPSAESPFPSEGALDFPQTMRFGTRIAEAASALTVTRPLQIVGNPDRGEGHLLLILFDEESAELVPSAFVEHIQGRVPTDELERYGVKVLAARRETGASKFPKDLGSYGLSLAASDSRTPSESLWEHTEAARRLLECGGEAGASAERIWTGVAEALEKKGVTYDGKRPTRRRVLDQLWKEEAAGLFDAKEELYKLSYQSSGGNDWESAVQSLFSRFPQAAEQPEAFSLYVKRPELEGDTAEAAVDEEAPEEAASYVFTTDTVHGAKGETHAATLMVEGWNNVFDLKEVLPILLGIHDKKRFVETKAVQPAARLTFVAMTRARHLVGLAVLKSHGEPYAQQLQEAGWVVRDLTDQ